MIVSWAPMGFGDDGKSPNRLVKRWVVRIILAPRGNAATREPLAA